MRESGDHVRGIMLAAGGMILISPDGLFFRLVSVGDFDVLFWRGLFSAAALSLYIQITTRGGIVGALRTGGAAGVLSAILLALATTCFVTSITRTAVANTLVILSTMPMFAAALGWLFLRERVGLRTWMAIAACIGGILLIFSGSLGGGSLLGDGLALCAALFLGANLVLIRATRHVSTFPAVALAGVIVAVVAAPLADPLAPTARDFALIAVMGVVFQATAWGLFLAGGRYLPPAEVGLFALVETVLGPFWAWLGVGETPSASAILGGTVVLATLVIYFTLALRRPNRLPT